MSVINEPGPDTVHVWHIALDRPADGLFRLLGLRERSRAARLPGGDPRRRFVVCHGTVRQILARYTGARPEGLRFATGCHGKPRLPFARPQFSLSHSGELAVLAVTAESDVGIDVELLRPGLPAAALAARFFPDDEARLLAARPPRLQAAAYAALWTRKEACVKAAGGRLAQGLGLRVAGPGGMVEDRTGALSGPWCVRDLRVGPGYVGTVAIAGARAPAINSYRWPDDPADMVTLSLPRS